MDVLKVLR